MRDYHDYFLKLIKENDEKLLKILENNPNFIKEFMTKTIDDSSEILYKNLNKGKSNMLCETRKEAEEFNKRLYKRWKKPIDNLETLIEVSFECATMNVETFYEEALEEDNLLFYALRNIHARAILTAKECLLLIKNGYPDGAFSRWRTLYELTVIGTLLFEEKDEDLCGRYLDFFFIQAYNEEKICREKGHATHTDSSFSKLKENYDYIIEKYEGNYINGEYGWANKVLNKARVTFRDIESKVDMGKYRGYYKSSSNFIHGNYKASEESLGIMPNIENLLLVGPSNYGLSIPIQNVAISLLTVSVCFLSVYPTIDTMSTCSIMSKFVDKILYEADKVQNQIEKEERILRGEISNLLLTSFKGKTNSSNLISKKIRTSKVIDKLELTNSFITSEIELLKKIKDNYEYIISFGQKPAINNICIEIFARKNETTLKTNFPYEKLKSFLNDKKIAFTISEDAGSYLCNNIYFEGLNYIYENNLKTKMVFIHVPVLNQSYKFNELSKLLSEFIEVLD